MKKPALPLTLASASNQQKLSRFSACVLTPLVLAIGACIVFLVAASIPANSGTPDKAAIEKIVADYISANGDKLKASIIAADNRAQAQALDGIINANTPTRGPADAAVTIIEFSDYECPFCARVQPTLRELETLYSGKVRFAFKQLPLPFHEAAKPAAYAALAAGQQGKYWPYHEALWANAASLNEATFVKIATSLNLNLQKFNTDRASPRIMQMVEQDLADSIKVGARGTPFFFINGEALSGALPLADFRTAIDAALAAAQ